jgi:hypothetical protein
MEILLLVLVFGFLIYLKNASDNRFDQLDEKLKNLNKSFDLLKKNEQYPEKSTQVFEKTIPKPVVEVPKQNPVFEEPKPIVFSEKIIPETPKTVFATNTDIPKVDFKKPEPKPYVPSKSFWETFKEKNPDLEKFIGENLINKIGVLILVLGISYFVKYSIDKGWIGEPARVGIGVLCGAIVMGVAHKLRQKYAAFSSVFVAGAIAIFYFTIGIAFHDYHLFGQTTAFVIMTIITAFSCLISLSYDRIELAILSLIGGFAVPFMVSTGEGNYVVLFTYITILNIGILALAYHKKWNLVNLLAYIFTIILFAGWLIKDISSANPHYLGGLIFGFIFYFIFILMNIVNNLRTKGELYKIQLGILASNTFLFYGAGMTILGNYHPEWKGLFTTFLGLLNLIYAWFLYKKFGLDKTTIYLLIGLTLTFITLAIPVQFQGNYITLFWSAESVLLLWLSQKSKISSYRFGSVIVSGLMIVSLIMDWNNIYSGSLNLNIIINKICITGIFAVTSLYLIYHLLKNETENIQQFGFLFNPIKYRKAIGVLSIVIAYFVGILEVGYQSDSYVAGVNSAVTLPILFHLIFSAGLFYFLCKINKVRTIQMATIIGLANIVLFAFWFSNYSFSEHKDYISSGIHQRIGFYLHYLSLMIVVYFGCQIYKISKENLSFNFLKTNIFVWIASFFVIYIASSEIILHGLVVSNSPVTLATIKSSEFNKIYPNDFQYIRMLISDNYIDSVRNQIVRTGLPILWGILAFVFLIFGIKKQNKTLRIIALSLLGITIAKLFLYDIRNVSETGKIIAFILLGVLVLIISFVYQKIKVLVLDDNKPKTTNENL